MYMFLSKGRTVFAFTLAFLFSLCSVHRTEPGIDLRINSDGSYTIGNSERTWLKSAPTWFNVDNHTYSTANRTLRLIETSHDYGFDNIGEWNITSLKYDANGTQFSVSFGTYQSVPLVFFGQTYLQDVHGTSSGDVQKVASAFPAFHIPNPAKTLTSGHHDKVTEKENDRDLGYYAIRGYMAGDDAKAFGRFNTKEFITTSGHHLGPVALYDGHGPTLIVSPFINFMASSKWIDMKTASLNYGFLGKASMIPKDTEMWTMAYYSDQGVNKAFEKWGNVMQTFYNAQNKFYAATDFTANYLGYWTDDGGYYYYLPEKNKTFEETFLDVKTYADKLDIPYRYIQLDSWFYPKSPMSASGGIIEWIPYKEFFPHGLEWLMNKTGYALATHCKWWSSKTPLAKQNGGPYDFHIEGKMALPIDPKFWIDILTSARRWGNVMFEQDWLAQMFDSMSILQSNVTIGRRYMLQMGKALLQTGMTYQQGTSYPRHVLMGLEIPPLTQQRVTMDYGFARYNWRIGVSSLWVYSLGQVPFKDVYWTTSEQNCPKYPGKKDPYVELESLVASLACGPVGPGDGIGKTNRTLLMRCCNEDGLILKPDKPATAIDAQFYESSFKSSVGPEGEVWSTYTQITGMFFGIIFAGQLNNTYNISPQSAGFPENLYVYTANSDPVPFTSTRPIIVTKSCTMLKYCLFYTTQALKMGKHEVFLLGEVTKWIPFSKNRIVNIVPRSADIFVTMTGAVMETVEFQAVIGGKRMTFSCNLGDGGRAVLSLQNGVCVST